MFAVALIAFALLSNLATSGATNNFQLNNQQKDEKAVQHGNQPFLEQFDFLALGLNEPTINPSTEPTAVPTNLGSFFSFQFSAPDDFSSFHHHHPADPSAEPTAEPSAEPTASPTGNSFSLSLDLPDLSFSTNFMSLPGPVPMPAPVRRACIVLSALWQCG